MRITKKELNKLPTYCSQCGSMCRWGEPKNQGYDSKTGKKVLEHKWICPKVGWFTMFHDNPYILHIGKGRTYRSYYWMERYEG